MADAALSMLPPPELTPRPPRDPDELLVRRHLRPVWRFLRLLGCTPDEADDLAQETFVVALEKGLGDRTAPQIAAFLRRTARHLFLRTRAKEDRRAALLAAAAEQLWARTCGDDGGDRRVAALRECVAELGGRGRQLVHLFYGEGRSRAAVAAAVGMRETGVKTALQRLRAALRDCIRRKTT